MNRYLVPHTETVSLLAFGDVMYIVGSGHAGEHSALTDENDGGDVILSKRFGFSTTPPSSSADNSHHSLWDDDEDEW